MFFLKCRPAGNHKTRPGGRANIYSAENALVYQWLGSKAFPHEIISSTALQGSYSTFQVIDNFKRQAILREVLISGIYKGHQVAATTHAADSSFPGQNICLCFIVAFGGYMHPPLQRTTYIFLGDPGGKPIGNSLNEPFGKDNGQVCFPCSE